MLKIGKFIINDADIIDKPVKLVLQEEATMTDNGDGTFTIETTKNAINEATPNKEYILQRTKYGYRCISHHPHYIMTDWVKTKKQALLDGDNAIEFYYNKFDPNFDIKPETMRRIERDFKNDKL